MNKEIKEITKQLKEILNKYPNRQHEILTYVFGKNNLIEVINKPTYEELQERINKAIEYIENDLSHIKVVGKRNKSYLLEILKGE